MVSEKIVLVACPPWARESPPMAVAILGEVLATDRRPFEIVDLNADVFDYLDHGADGLQLWSMPELRWWSEPWYSEQTQYRLAPALTRAAARILRAEPAFVGLSCPSWLSTGVAADLCRRLRAARPGVVLIGGGAGLYGSFKNLVDADAFDYIVDGEGEHTLPKLLDALSGGVPPDEVARIPGVLHWSAPGGPPGEPLYPGPVDGIPAQSSFPRFARFDLGRYSELPLLASRGCTQRCHFCDEFDRQGRTRHRPMDPEWVVDAMRYYASLGFRYISLNDLLMNGDIAALERLADLLIEADLGVNWRGNLAIRKNMDGFPFEKLRRAGLATASIGVESFSDPVLRGMGAVYTAERAAAFLRDVSAVGIEVLVTLIVGFPGEREEHFAEFLERLKEHSSNMSMVGINVCYLQKNTGLWRRLGKCGVELGTLLPVTVGNKSNPLFIW